MAKGLPSLVVTLYELGPLRYSVPAQLAGMIPVRVNSVGSGWSCAALNCRAQNSEDKND